MTVMTDETCPNCGSPVVIKQGRWGEFKACSNYPKCKLPVPSARKEFEQTNSAKFSL